MKHKKTETEFTELLTEIDAEVANIGAVSRIQLYASRKPVLAIENGDITLAENILGSALIRYSPRITDVMTKKIDEIVERHMHDCRQVTPFTDEQIEAIKRLINNSLRPSMARAQRSSSISHNQTNQHEPTRIV